MKMLIKNLKYWLVLRLLDYIAVFCISFIYYQKQNFEIFVSFKQAFIHANLIILLLYIFLGYIFFSFFIYIISSYFKKNIFLYSLNFLTPFYILGAIIIAGSLPKIELSYIYNNITPLLMVLFSSIIHLLVYKFFYIDKFDK